MLCCIGQQQAEVNVCRGIHQGRDRSFNMQAFLCFTYNFFIDQSSQCNLNSSPLHNTALIILRFIIVMTRIHLPTNQFESHVLSLAFVCI